MTKQPDYQSLSLKIVPSGSRRTVTELRALIASTLEREVQAALTRQREEEFPELAASRQELTVLRQKLDGELDDMKRKHLEKEEELRRRHAALELRKLALHQLEVGLQELIRAFEDYEAWLEGAGEIDENGKRFAALQQAYRTYKSLQPKKDKEL